jgi:hypothetical protein
MFTLPDPFSVVPRVSSPVLMFVAPGLVFGETQGVGSHFHVLRYQTRFRWCGVSRIPFSSFVLPDSFSAISTASGPIFMFCVPILVFDGTEGVGSHFHVLRGLVIGDTEVVGSCFNVLRARIFGGAEGVGSRFNILRSLSRFRRIRECRLPFSCFARPNSFSTVPTTSGPVFKFSLLD